MSATSVSPARRPDQIEKVLYTAKTHTTGGRDGASRSSDGRLDVKLSPPGAAGTGTNPEQLFAAGWSACFEGAMGLAARKMKVALPADLAIDAEVDLGMTDGGYFLQARLNVSLPGLDARGRPGRRGRRAPDLPVLQGHTRQHRRRDQSGLSRACDGSGLLASDPGSAIPQIERATTCPKTINHHRRRFFGTAAMTLPPPSLSRPAPRAPSPARQRRSSTAIKPGTNTSFGPLKQIDAGVLNVGYAEAGPADGPRSSFCTAGPTTSTAMSMSLRCWPRPATG